jgi:hypothetical protein
MPPWFVIPVYLGANALIFGAIALLAWWLS